MMNNTKLPEIPNVGVLRAAIKEYGNNPQIDVAVEEMSELIKALMKYKRTLLTTYGPCEAEIIMHNIIDGIADVSIMLWQLIDIFGCAKEVQERVGYKVARLAERLGGVNE